MRTPRSTEEWLTVAKGLVKEHGKLPAPQWLFDHGYRGLYSATRRRPELFASLTRHWTFLGSGRRREVIAIAEKLAKRYGAVPRRKWLADNGYLHVYTMMRRHPELFKHIPVDCPVCYYISHEECRKIIRRLAKQNGGLLPSRRSLKDAEYGWLADKILHDPTLLDGVEQESTRSKHDRYLLVAEALVKKRRKLPKIDWLMSHGYEGLARSIQDSPARYAHFRQA